MISPAHVPSTGFPERTKSTQRLGQALSLDAEADRRRLAARNDECVESLEIVAASGPRAAGTETRKGLRMGLEAALEGEDPDAARSARHQPRCWRSPPFSSSVPISMPGMASPSSREAAAMRSGSS